MIRQTVMSHRDLNTLFNQGWNRHGGHSNWYSRSQINTCFDEFFCAMSLIVASSKPPKAKSMT